MNAKPKILIVDDKPENLVALEVVLRGLNVELVRQTVEMKHLKLPCTMILHWPYWISKCRKWMVTSWLKFSGRKKKPTNCRSFLFRPFIPTI